MNQYNVVEDRILPPVAQLPVPRETSSAPCPACFSTDVSRLGPVFHRTPAMVAGVEIDLGLTSFWLMRCATCGLQFKYPSVEERKLLACYEQASGDQWGEEIEPLSRRFDAIRDILQDHSKGRRILDVGCFNGSLLGYLGAGWDRYGLEPGRAAAAIAERRGIKIIGATLNDIGAHERFDAITAIDVVEHIVEPTSFFRAVQQALSPGGIFVLVTGDTQSFLWRLHGSRYWYCGLPEHVSFFCRETIDYIGKTVGLETIHYTRMPHWRLPIGVRIHRIVKDAAFLFALRSRAFGVKPLARHLSSRPAPGLCEADHMFAAMRKLS